MSAADPYTRLAGVYDDIVVDPSHARWAGFLRELWDADAVGVRTVLDVCCGTGLLAAELIAAGYRVTGIDASPDMLARARDRLGPDVALVRQTLPSLTLVTVFDAAVSTFDGLNYLTPVDLRTSFAALHERIRPGGWFVFDAHTDAMMSLAAARPVLDGDVQGRRYVITNTVDTRARTCDSQIEVAGDGATFTERHRQHFHSDGEIAAALTGAGFGAFTRTDEYTHRPVDASTLRATWIARRQVPAGA